MLYNLDMRKILILFLILFLSPLTADTITLATLNWLPSFGEDLPEQGFFSALCREAFRRAGYELELKFIPWMRALEMAKYGYYDGVMGVYYCDERTRYFLFSDPIYKSREVFVVRKGFSVEYSELEDLMGMSVGIIKGYSYEPELRAMGLELEATMDDARNLRQLFYSRIDIVIIEQRRLVHLLNTDETLQPFRDKYSILDIPFRNLDLYCTINRIRDDGAIIVEKFNRALREMRTDGTYEAILKRFNLSFDSEN